MEMALIKLNSSLLHVCACMVVVEVVVVGVRRGRWMVEEIFIHFQQNFANFVQVSILLHMCQLAVFLTRELEL